MIQTKKERRHSFYETMDPKTPCRSAELWYAAAGGKSPQCTGGRRQHTEWCVDHWWSNELLATANPEADGTLNWENGYNPFESVQIEYDATSKTYKFEGMLTPPKNGYMTIKRIPRRTASTLMAATKKL